MKAKTTGRRRKERKRKEMDLWRCCAAAVMVGRGLERVAPACNPKLRMEEMESGAVAGGEVGL